MSGNSRKSQSKMVTIQGGSIQDAKSSSVSKVWSTSWWTQQPGRNFNLKAEQKKFINWVMTMSSDKFEHIIKLPMLGPAWIYMENKEFFLKVIKLKYEKAKEFKIKGNSHFSNSRHVEAIQAYKEGISYITFGDFKSIANDEVRSQVLILFKQLLNNISQCYIALEKWDEALQICASITNLDENDLKAYYRASKWLMSLGNLDLSYVKAEEGLKLAKSQNDVSSSQEFLALKNQISIMLKTSDGDKKSTNIKIKNQTNPHKNENQFHQQDHQNDLRYPVQFKNSKDEIKDCFQIKEEENKAIMFEILNINNQQVLPNYKDNSDPIANAKKLKRYQTALYLTASGLSGLATFFVLNNFSLAGIAGHGGAMDGVGRVFEALNGGGQRVPLLDKIKMSCLIGTGFGGIIACESKASKLAALGAIGGASWWIFKKL